MFDIGFWELLIIGAVALLVVGPDRLPGLATFIGQWVGRARKFTNHMRNEIQQELEAEHLKGLVDEQQRELKSLRDEVEGVRDEADAAVREVERESKREARAWKSGSDARDDDAGDANPAEPDTIGAPATATAAAQTSPQDASPAQPAAKKTAAKKASAKKAASKKAASKKKTGARKKAATKKTAAAATGLDDAGSTRQDGGGGSAQQGEDR